MEHSILFIMSLSGSIVLFVYLLVYLFARKLFSLTCKYYILKISLFFYLIPFPIILPWLRKALLEVFPTLANDFNKPLASLSTKYAMCINTTMIYFSAEARNMFVFAFLFLMISFVIILFQGLRCSRINKICLKYSDIIREQKWREQFYAIKKELKINRKVGFLCSEYCNTPMTIGIFSPKVIVPIWNEDMIENNLYRSIIKHELVHVKQRDLLIKMLAMIVIAIHWFNPFTYILYYEISNISEMCCDSIVLKGKNHKERKEYGELLLNFATKMYIKNKFAVGIIGANGRIAIKRRILEMKEDRENKTILSIMLLLLICILGGITTSAYDPPASITIHEDTISSQQGSDFQFVAGELQPIVEELPYDFFFVDDVGNVYNLNEKEIVSKLSCTHKYVSGTSSLHKKDSNGGCKTTYYESWRCSLCGNIKLGKEINTLTYKKCPH